MRASPCLRPQACVALQVRGVLLLALGKLSTQSGRALTPDASSLLAAATSSGSVELQQRALEVQALLR